jgi:hypothetical protein
VNGFWVSCTLVESQASSFWNVPTAFKTLNVTTPTSGADAGKLVLQGTFNALSDGNVGVVETGIERNPPTGTLGADSLPEWGFSARVLGTSIPVTTGQQVLITVRFSFS